MSKEERLVCHDCKRDEQQRKIFPVATFKAVDERYEFPDEYRDHALCVKCAKGNYLTKGFVVSQHTVSMDFHYNEKDYYDVVHLNGEALILRIKDGMYVFKYEDTYSITPDLDEEDFESSEDYWDAVEQGRKEVPISILVLINGKSIIGKGSKQYRSLIEEIIEEFNRKN